MLVTKVMEPIELIEVCKSGLKYFLASLYCSGFVQKCTSKRHKTVSLSKIKLKSKTNFEFLVPLIVPCQPRHQNVFYQSLAEVNTALQLRRTLKYTVTLKDKDLIQHTEAVKVSCKSWVDSGVQFCTRRELYTLALISYSVAAFQVKTLALWKEGAVLLTKKDLNLLYAPQFCIKTPISLNTAGRRSTKQKRAAGNRL